MPGTLDELNCVSPTPTTSSSGAGDGLHDARVRSFNFFSKFFFFITLLIELIFRDFKKNDSKILF